MSMSFNHILTNSSSLHFAVVTDILYQWRISFSHLIVPGCTWVGSGSHECEKTASYLCVLFTKYQFIKALCVKDNERGQYFWSSCDVTVEKMIDLFCSPLFYTLALNRFLTTGWTSWNQEKIVLYYLQQWRWVYALCEHRFWGSQVSQSDLLLSAGTSMGHPDGALLASSL